MSTVSLLYYSSSIPFQKTSILSIKQVSGSSIPKASHVYHYEAIEAVAKGSQPYLSLCLETSSNSIADDEPHLIQLSEKTSLSLLTRSPFNLNNPATKSILTKDRATTVIPKQQINSKPKPNPKPIEHGPRVMEDAIPKGERKDLILWTDDDLDSVDYKNTPDYDPDQDDTEYGTTSESEPEPEPEPEPGSFMGEKSKAAREKITFRKYIQLQVTVAEGKVKSFG